MRSRRFRIPVTFAVSLAALSAACSHSDQVTGPPAGAPVAATPTPTPVPSKSVSIAGDWSGTMAPTGCQGDFPASVTITQTGDAVAGTLRENGCTENFSTLQFSGTYQSGNLSGTTRGEFPGRLTGVLSGNVLTIDLFKGVSIYMGRMTLTPR